MKIILLLLLVTLFACSKKTQESEQNQKPVLKILTWDGYADYKFVKEFEMRNNVIVKVDLVQNDDELWAKINDSKNQYDLFAANTAEIVRYLKANLLAELELDKIPNIKNQNERFTDYEKIFGKRGDGKIFAIPYAYSEMGLIYNKNLIKTPPQSMKVMWDKKYKGKVIAYDTYQHNFSVVALMENYPDPFNLNEKELNDIFKKLVELKQNSLAFYTTLEESAKIFKENDVALVYGNFGKQQVDELKKNGANVGYIIPQESALAWLDCWGVTNYSKQKKLAQEWINYTLSEDVSNNLSQAHSLGNTMAKSQILSTTEKITWLRPVSNPEFRKKLWDSLIHN